jgi:hypothetical protein
LRGSDITSSPQAESSNGCSQVQVTMIRIMLLFQAIASYGFY